MNKYITEFIGTFFLVLIIGMNAFAGPVNLLAIAAVLLGMIYAGGHISGAHYNPAVTLSILVRGRIALTEALVYMIVQIIAASAAAIVTAKLFDVVGAGTSAFAEGNVAKALSAEILGTFALAFVVLNVATAKANAGKSHYGLAIAFTVLACGYILGHFSGGAFNPAVAIGQCINGGFAWADLWVYLVGCFGGALLAALVFNFCNPDDK